MVVSNPPYIKSSEKQSMHPNVLNHEPHLALFVEGEDDILFYTKIVDLCKTVLLPEDLSRTQSTHRWTGAAKS